MPVLPCTTAAAAVAAIIINKRRESRAERQVYRKQATMHGRQRSVRRRRPVCISSVCVCVSVCRRMAPSGLCPATTVMNPAMW